MSVDLQELERRFQAAIDSVPQGEEEPKNNDYMAKYTAVEYLIQQVNNVFGHDRITVDQALQLMNVANEAKRMEREQIIQARGSGIEATVKGYSISNEDYYEETYVKR